MSIKVLKFIEMFYLVKNHCKILMILYLKWRIANFDKYNIKVPIIFINIIDILKNSYFFISMKNNFYDYSS